MADSLLHRTHIVPTTATFSAGEAVGGLTKV